MNAVPPAPVVLEAAATAPALELACRTEGSRIVISVINRSARSAATRFDLVVTSSSGNVVHHVGSVSADAPRDLVLSKTAVEASSFRVATLRTDDNVQSRSSCNKS